MRSGTCIGLGILVAATGCGGGGGGGGESQPAGKSWQVAEYVAAFAGLQGIPQAAARLNGEIVALIPVEGAPIPGGNQGEIFAYHMTPEGGRTVASLTSKGHNPCLVADRKGNLEVFWEESVEQEVQCTDAPIKVNVSRIFRKTQDVLLPWDPAAEPVTGEVRSSQFSGTAQQAQNEGTEAVQVRAARNTSGSTIAVWKQVKWKHNSTQNRRVVTESRLYARRYDPTSIGSPREIRLSASPETEGTQHRVILNESGAAVLVWTEGTTLHAAFLDSQLVLGNIVTLDTQLDYSSVKEPPFDGLHLAAGPDRVLVMWARPSDGLVRCASLHVPTRTLEKIEIVSSNSGHFLSLGLAGDGSQGATAVWSQYQGTGTLRIRGRRFNFAQAQWSPSIETIQDGGGDGRFPAIAMNSSGTALVAWGQDNALATLGENGEVSFTLSFNLYGRSLPGGGPAPIQADTGVAVRAVTSVAIDEAGNGAALMVQLKPTTVSTFQIFLSRYR